jgi:MFS family permease
LLACFLATSARNFSEASPIVTHTRDQATDDVLGSVAHRAPAASATAAECAVRNFAGLAVFQIGVRAGWIFKTESIVMPAVLDSIAGAGWIRGWLPLLNRIGHSVPPLLLSRRVTIASQKKWVLFTATMLMSLWFMMLAALLFGFAQTPPAWMPLVFLVIYALFFMCVGVNQVAFSTLQGKLVPADRRGRLLWVSNTVGSVAAIVCALVLMPRWLEKGATRFDLIFGLSGFLFGLSAFTLLCLVEPRDHYRQAAQGLRQIIHSAGEVFRTDATFRRLALAGALFSASIMLFPHYQNLGLRGMQMDLKNLVWWVVIQNLGTGLFSVPAGAVADRWGNRRVLQLTLLGIAAAPTLAIGLLHFGAKGRMAYPLVFVLVGLTPVVYRTFHNFALEICSPPEHPRYLSCLGLCMAAPMCASPLVGLAIDALGFEIVFVAIALIVLAGWFVTFRLAEPRRHVTVGIYPTDD